MNEKIYEYDEIIHSIPEKGGAYVIFPWNIREEFGRGRFHLLYYRHYKSYPAKINKGDGDQVHVIIKERE